MREQLNVLIQIGNINKKTTQFLFPDLDPEGIVIPIGKGTGLIQIIDNEHPYQVLPLLLSNLLHQERYFIANEKTYYQKFLIYVPYYSSLDF